MRVCSGDDARSCSCFSAANSSVTALYSRPSSPTDGMATLLERSIGSWESTTSLELKWRALGLFWGMPSLSGEGAKRSGLGDIERSIKRLAAGRGGILGTDAGESSLSWPREGRGGMAGVCCIVAAVIVVYSDARDELKCV